MTILGLLLLGATPVYSDPPVSYMTYAAPVRRVVAEIAEKSGSALKVSDNLGAHYLVVKVDGVPLSDLRAKIAEVTTGKWTLHEDGSMTLERDAAKWAQAVQADRQAKREHLGHSIAQRLKYLAEQEAAQMEDVSGEHQIIHDVGASAPVHIALSRILGQMDLAFLAELKPQERVVFSSSPTRMQRPLSASATQVLAQLVVAHNAEVAKSKGKPDPLEGIPPEARKYLEALRSFMPRTFDDPITEPPAKALVIVSRDASIWYTQDVDVRIELRFYDRNGTVILAGETSVSSGSEWDREIDAMSESIGAVEEEVQSQTESPAIKLRPESLAMAAAFQHAGSMGPTISAATMQALLQPDLHDPLSFAPSDVVIHAAGARNLVANLPDQAVQLPVSDEGGVTGDSYTDTSLYRVLEDERWYVLIPANPVTTENTRADRLALAKLAQASYTKGVPSLPDAMEYARTVEDPLRSPINYQYFNIFCPNSITGQGGLSQTFDMLRLYALLGEGQRLALRRGERLRLDTLTTDAREWVHRMIFGSEALLEAGSSEGGDALDDALDPYLAIMATTFGAGPGKNYLTEPTEVLPAGITNQCLLSLKLSDETMVIPVTQQGNLAMHIGPLGITEMALFRMIMQTPLGANTGELEDLLARMRVGKLERLRFTIHLGSEASMRRQLMDPHVDKNSAMHSMATLPKAFQDSVDAQYKKLLDSPMGQFWKAMMGLEPPDLPERQS